MCISWWRHQMETFSALLAFCAGNSPVPGEFSAQRPVTRSFDVFFDLHLNKQLSKQSRGWLFETPSGSLWRQCNAYLIIYCEQIGRFTTLKPTLDDDFDNLHGSFYAYAWLSVYVRKIYTVALFRENFLESNQNDILIFLYILLTLFTNICAYFCGRLVLCPWWRST